jgi:signal transduction histidine kinase
MSDPTPVQLPKTGFCPKELRVLITNVNKLLSKTARIRHAELEVVAKVGDGIINATAAGEIMYVNGAGIKLLGDVRGHDLSEIIGSGPAAEILQPQDFKEWKGSLRLKRADGNVFDSFLTSTPVVEDGTLSSVVLLIRDRTREKAGEAVSQSDEKTTLRELVADTSHELNNPLAIVMGYSDLLLEDETLNVEQRMKIESIRKNAMRAASVAYSLLAFARKRQFQRVPSDISFMVESACQLKEHDLRKSGITLDKNLTAGLPSVLADPYQIQRVLLNIINNAQDAVANSKTPRIRIATESSTAGVVVKVEDSGTGKAGGRGAGLGLSVIYGIIREHDGDITTVSHPDGGTTVSIVLPASPPEFSFVAEMKKDQLG